MLSDHLHEEKKKHRILRQQRNGVNWRVLLQHNFRTVVGNSFSWHLARHAICHPTIVHTSPQPHDKEQARSETVDTISQRHTTHLFSSWTARFSFRIHMSLVFHTLMDKCEIERNPIPVVAVKALDDTHLKYCIQMYYSLVLITKGSVQTLVRSVGTKAWRLLHSRCAPDTQNPQYALMQKIMMPAKLWCDHAESFESGLRVWELDVGEWKRASGTALTDAIK